MRKTYFKKAMFNLTLDNSHLQKHQTTTITLNGMTVLHKSFIAKRIKIINYKLKFQGLQTLSRDAEKLLL